MANPLAAANAYASLSRLGSGAGHVQSLGSADKGAGPSFASLVENALGNMMTKGAEADAKAGQLAAGKADLVEVVTAVAESEVAVETLVSVRDKVISAYEEIFRMPI